MRHTTKEKAEKKEHLVYLNWEAKELEKLLNKEKSMVVRGGAGKRLPLGGRASIGEAVYLLETGGEQLVTHRGKITQVIESEKLTPDESLAFLQRYTAELNLSQKQFERWNGKKRLAVYEIGQIEAIEPFQYARGNNMADWVIVDSIEEIKA
ncbi:hypothetical protein NRIC_10970 [Enterococcus florum]|uniref:ASCH domain-containing protein n=1 Tax=Enterococcus florum TaxID=2480627 RepID=A0A4P5P702_9ENTE|nr:hypothetical protein [Enterococcus florum]GCF93206.1 hypothetical protein NRIC_10970 [Enterococcus florum]